jgi:hypothetical protein
MILKAWEKSNFTNALEGNLLEDEVASNRFGSYSFLLFGGIILISSSISLSHYIRRYLSWTRLSLNRIIIVWRVILQIMLERFALVLQVRFWIFFIQGIGAKECVLKKRAIERGPCNIKAWVVFSTLYSLNTVMNFFPI